MSKRCVTYRKRWNELVENYGPRCFYCRREIATCIDHVIPYSYDQDNEIENLVPACTLCNALASNKHFSSAEEKRHYILQQRKSRGNKNAICTRCLLPFAYRIHSPSLLLCAECYDEEFGTKNAETREWKKWLIQLRAAGIPAEAHRAMKKKLANIKYKNMEVKVELLIDEYARVVDTDDEFATMLIIT